jgi:hypothetical protein
LSGFEVVPLQSAWTHAPVPMQHCPVMQVSPVVHAFPHLPQFEALVCVLMHALVHHVSAVAQQ